MKWYPWLNITYRQIITRYQQDSRHNVLLICSQPGNGVMSLCYALSRWLMCRERVGIKSCSVCRSCRLMISGNHPDFYQIKFKNNHRHLNEDENINFIINKIYNHAGQGWMKIICLLNVELLTEQISGTLLKILEEPPIDTYFLLICQTPLRIMSSIRSRCMYWYLPTPNETIGLRWLEEAGFNNSLNACTALRISAHAPLAAKVLLEQPCWYERLALCTALQEAQISGNFLALLSILNHNTDIRPLHWMLSLISDAVKFQHGIQYNAWINADKVELISQLSTNWPTKILNTLWQQGLQCIRFLQEINGINRELLITNYLLKWEQKNDKSSSSIKGEPNVFN